MCNGSVCSVGGTLISVYVLLSVDCMWGDGKRDRSASTCSAQLGDSMQCGRVKHRLPWHIVPLDASVSTPLPYFLHLFQNKREIQVLFVWRQATLHVVGSQE